MNDLINTLNDAQKLAVTSEAAQQLILAGAGSGKTRVLVHRLAWLITNKHISPYQILAVTFTNKTAHEMQQRVENLLNHQTSGMWIGTFHGIAHRLLRKHWHEAGLVENFQIIDSADQQRLIKRIINNLQLDETHWPAKQAQWFINQQKDQGIRAQHVENYNDFFTENMLSIYTAYQDLCTQSGLVDFAELLLRSHELWLNNPEILAHYQQRLRYLLVDEFQDTNAVQYAWLRLLAGDQGNIMIVGDDDQSIYGWRGADASNIQRFCHDYPQAETIRLEQNYRSTRTILNAANAVIAENQQRLGKNLWTEGAKGEPIQCYQAFNEIDEARFIVHQIEKLFPQTGQYQHIAILYRSNAQSRVIEDALIHAQISYRIYGGLRFFERAEIKDTLAYCRLCIHHDDDTAFERILNLPTRGIGERTLMELRTIAQQQPCSLWQASQIFMHNDTFSARARKAVEQFIHLIAQLTEENRDKLLDEQINHTIQQSGLINHYQREKGETGQFRIDNLEELVNAAAQYRLDNGGNQGSMTEFLAHTTLEVGDSQTSEHNDYVQLMTLHSAKGLEFPIVFMCGMEQELFPRNSAFEDPKRFEEERRLCYVGITRAMHTLYITYAKRRRLYQKNSDHTPSCFIQEIPREFIHHIRFTQQAQPMQQYNKTAHPALREANSRFHIGQNVTHPSFGDGIITGVEGQGASTRVQVKFHHQGSKWLVLSHAPLEPA
jgi:DNA helicase II / ATP-dependent DNA helicase PcrA